MHMLGKIKLNEKKPVRRLNIKVIFKRLVLTLSIMTDSDVLAYDATKWSISKSKFKIMNIYVLKNTQDFFQANLIYLNPKFFYVKLE